MSDTDREPDTVYEPWKPQVGDRVRISLSPECQQKLYSWDALGSPSPIPGNHEWLCNGETGVIVDIDREPGVFGDPPNGHFYVVECDHGLEDFAAIELLPLDPPATGQGSDGEGV